MYRIVNALSVASSKGYGFLDSSAGECHNGVFFNRFTKSADRQGACLWVGYNHRMKRWEFHRNTLPATHAAPAAAERQRVLA